MCAPTVTELNTWEQRSINFTATGAPKVNGNRKAIFPANFVLDSLRHTMLTRLGESGVDAFAIMRMSRSQHHCCHGITVSERYIHPMSEAVKLAFKGL